MTIPTISNNINTDISTITLTSTTTVITPMLPPSDDVYLCTSEEDGDGGDDDTVDQQTMATQQMYSIQTVSYTHLTLPTKRIV